MINGQGALTLEDHKSGVVSRHALVVLFCVPATLRNSAINIGEDRFSTFNIGLEF